MNITKEDQYLLAYVLDQYEKFLTKGIGCTSFLDEREFPLVCSFLKQKRIPYFVSQPHEMSCKKMIVFEEDEMNPYYVIYRIKQTGVPLTHSDILGSLFALGVKREVIGDIFVEQDVCYFVVLKRIEHMVDMELCTIGNHRISLEKVESISLQEVHEQTTMMSLSSLRMDCVLSKLLSCSRSQAWDYLTDKKVLLNYQVSTARDKVLREGDILSVRSLGKFRIGKTLGVNKKGKQQLEVIQYH